jgi:hypothetical protein
MDQAVDKESRDYISRHKLDDMLGEMLFLLLKVKPENPMIYMIKFLA